MQEVIKQLKCGCPTQPTTNRVLLPPNILSNISYWNNLITLQLGLAVRTVVQYLTWEEVEVVEMGLWTLPYYKVCLYKHLTVVGFVVVKTLSTTYFFRLVIAIDSCYVVISNFFKLKTLTKESRLLLWAGSRAARGRITVSGAMIHA
jgi:hypothetical protein